MTNLEEIEKLIKDARESGEDVFITALKITNVYEKATAFQVTVLDGNIVLVPKTCPDCGGKGVVITGIGELQCNPCSGHGLIVEVEITGGGSGATVRKKS